MLDEELLESVIAAGIMLFIREGELHARALRQAVDAPHDFVSDVLQNEAMVNDMRITAKALWKDLGFLVTAEAEDLASHYIEGGGE